MDNKRGHFKAPYSEQAAWQRNKGRGRIKVIKLIIVIKDRGDNCGN